MFFQLAIEIYRKHPWCLANFTKTSDYQLGLFISFPLLARALVQKHSKIQERVSKNL